MKILAISDLHVDPAEPLPWTEFLARAQEEQPDVLVVAGDLAAGKDVIYETLLSAADFFSGPKLFVPGNHDLWQLHSKRQTWQRYDEELPAAVSAGGWQYLDLGPVLLDDVAFIGCAGWYDYSLRQVTSPDDDVRVTPGVVTAPRRGMKTSSARAHLRWEDLQADDYRSKALQVNEDNVAEGVIWNDVYYVDWRSRDGEGSLTDEDVTAYFCDKLRGQAAQVARRARRIVAVTHFVPFAETLPDYSEVAPAYARAFAGSVRLGETLLGLRKVTTALFGHWHRGGKWQIGHIEAHNVSAKNGASEGTLITV